MPVFTQQFVRAMLDSVPALRAQEVLIIDEEPNHVVTSEVLATEEEESASDEKLMAVLRRLHNHLGHPSTCRGTDSGSQTWSGVRTCTVVSRQILLQHM